MQNSCAKFLACLSILLFLNACKDSDDCLETTWFKDSDGDTRGDAEEALSACEQPVGYVENDDDDDDTTPCAEPVSWYADSDSDGLGDSENSIEGCIQPEGYVDNDDDPDDTQCQPETWYQDADGDGLGNSDIHKESCENPIGYVDNFDDTNDAFGDLYENEVEVYNEELAYDGYVLLNELAKNTIRLISKDGRTLSVWDLGPENELANDAELLENGVFLSTLKVDNPPLPQGGFGGKVEMRSASKELVWEYNMSSLDALQHHDVEMLPNGNVLVMAWEQRDEGSILEKGYKGTATTLNTESIYEINPMNDEIVWEWHVWDHLIQDQDDSKETYGVLVDNPQKVNLNYITDTPEFMHANGIDFDKERDLIFISVRYYSEIWVIDHSISTIEASGTKGDLVYRFGNPETYDGSGERFLYKQHHPNLLEGSQPGAGNLLVFSNEHYGTQSAVLEIDLPEVFDFSQQPTIVWEFTDPELFSPILSGAERLPNGNTLISIGTQGTVWEVTSEKEVVWRFRMESNPPRIWRSYSYSKDDPAVVAIGL